MKILIVAVSALVVGIALGIVFSAATIRHLRQRNRELRAIIREEAGPVYAVKSAVENLSKNNRWPDKGQQPEDEPPEDGDQAAG